jgi:hypothetical protein
MASNADRPVLPLDLRFVLGATALDVAIALEIPIDCAAELLVDLERDGLVRRLGDA